MFSRRNLASGRPIFCFEGRCLLIAFTRCSLERESLVLAHNFLACKKKVYFFPLQLQKTTMCRVEVCRLNFRCTQTLSPVCLQKLFYEVCWFNVFPPPRIVSSVSSWLVQTLQQIRERAVTHGTHNAATRTNAFQRGWSLGGEFLKIRFWLVLLYTHKSVMRPRGDSS